MIASSQPNHLTVSEYLELEAESLIKHEYIDGEIYAMAGASDAHVTICLNLASDLRNHLRASGCRVYMSDMKVRLESLNRFFYPDIFVTCDSQDKETANYKQFPCLIVEVISESTEAFDRGDKFIDYQTISSLQEYVLISTKRQRLECFRRNEQGLWVIESYGSNVPSFQLKSLNFQGSFQSLYENVPLT